MRLSGGERQRIALARAFLKDAPIVLLDEPTSAVDVETEAAIMEALQRLTKVKTTFLIAHRRSTLQHCDLWLELEGGRLVRVTSSAPPLVEQPMPVGTQGTAVGTPLGSEDPVTLGELRERTKALRRRLRGLSRGIGERGGSRSGNGRAQASASEGSKKDVKRAAPIVVRSAVLEHPATKAWRTLTPGDKPPDRIESLKETNKALVYRLTHAGPGGTNVIAKRRRREALHGEATIHGIVLPRVPVPTPHYYGLVEEPDGEHAWIFLEDAGDVAYSPLIAPHRTLAARWLALLHTKASEIAAEVGLPDRGASHYLEHLRAASEKMLQGRGNDALRPDDIAVLDDLLAQCSETEARWEEIERLSEGMPPTLVHGDFVPKNVRVRAGRDGIVLLPFDWGTGGWGEPAADLAETDPTLYWQFMSEHWRNLDLPVVTRVAKVGRLFRVLAAVHCASQSLAYPWIEKPMAQLRLYRGWLADARQLLDQER